MAVKDSLLLPMATMLAREPVMKAICQESNLMCWGTHTRDWGSPAADQHSGFTLTQVPQLELEKLVLRRVYHVIIGAFWNACEMMKSARSRMSCRVPSDELWRSMASISLNNRLCSHVQEETNERQITFEWVVNKKSWACPAYKRSVSSSQGYRDGRHDGGGP